MIWNPFKKEMSHTRMQLEDWLGNLEIEGDSVADVGGEKLPVQYRVKSWHVKHYDILDLPEYDLNRPMNLSKSYDAVFCLEVFEYIFDPFQAMKNLYSIIKPGGTLYVSFHFIYPHHDPWGVDFLRYTRWGVKKLLKEAGFKDFECQARFFKNPQTINKFYSIENMKMCKPGNAIHLDQGYLVRAVKDKR